MSSYNALGVTPKYSIDLQLYGNPITMEFGRNVSLDLYIKNTGNVSETIDSIDLVFPNIWEHSNISSSTIPLEPNKTILKNIEVMLPQNTASGKYEVGVLVTTPHEDYVAHTELNINRLESIPFSGNIPLSVLVLIVSGLITYFIIIYFITRKFKRGYVEIGLVSILFGLLNWLIARSLPPPFNVVKYIETLHNDPLGAFMIIGVGFASGMGGFAIYKLGKYIKKLYYEWQHEKERKKSIFTRGYQVTGKSDATWYEFITRRLDFVSQNIGKKYSITIRIYLKSDSARWRYIDGIWEIAEERRPIDISLGPKRIVFVTNRKQIYDVLYKHKKIIEDVLKYDSTYRKLIKQRLEEKEKASFLRDSIQEIRDEMLKKMDKVIDKDDFVTFMEEYDFSRFVVAAAHYLRKDSEYSLKTAMRYQGPVFIPFESIEHVEIIGYETKYAISVVQNLWEEIFPRTYIVSDVFPLDDKTIG